MTKELFRLPLLWIAPERRSLLQKRICKLILKKIITKLFVFYYLTNTDIEKNKLEKYIEGFNYVYQYYDKSIAHETNFGRRYCML
jgi:hypothetical protein